jgi:WD40 repeat protein
MTLERVVGISARNNNQLTINPDSGEIAYPVGSIVCLYNPKSNKQTRFFSNEKNRNFRSVAFSEDGQYLAAGEGTTKQPEITIWKLIPEEEPIVYATLKGHKLSIEALLFSPNSRYLISLGDENDKGLFVWDVERKIKITCNKLSKVVRAIAFSEDCSYFVTGGIDHLKFWYFDETGYPILAQMVEEITEPSDASEKEKPNYVMENKSADLTKIKVRNFVGVVCKDENVYALTVDGLLYVIND